MLTLRFWKGTLIRAVRTFAQGFGGTAIGTGIGFWDLDWKTALGIGLTAALGSVLQSIDRAPKDPSEDDVQPVVNNSVTIVRQPVDVVPAEAP